MKVTDFVGKLATLAVAMAVAVGAETARAETKTWKGATGTSASVAANWSPEGVPQSGDSIVLDANAVSNLVWDLDDVSVKDWTQNGFAGNVYFETGESGATAKGKAQTVHGVLVDTERILQITGDLNLQSGTWLGKNNPSFNATDTQRANGRGIYRMIVHVGGAATIGESVMLSVVSNGFQYGECQGADSRSSGAGGSHGGCGCTTLSYSTAIGSGTAPNHCYGSIRQPRTIGSCGHDDLPKQTLPGGAIRLKVVGALTLNGKLNANAASALRPGQTAWRAVGSGGSVWVTASSISGSGTITANGWNGNQSFGFCSGGGRIAVNLTGAGADFSQFPVSQMTAYGGNNNGSATASAGTIYLETPATKEEGGELYIKGNYSDREVSMSHLYGTEIWSGLEDTDFTFKYVHVENNVSLRIENGITFKTAQLGGVKSAYNQVRLYNRQFEITGDQPVTNASLVVAKSDTVFGKTLRLGKDSCFLPNYLTTINGDLIMTENAKVTHWGGQGSTKSYWVNLAVEGDVTVGANASFDVQERGYSQACGPGKPGIGECASAHGGMPGNANTTGTTYGDFREPNTLSSGSSHTCGSGAIELTVKGTLTNDGLISAKGTDQVNFPAAGGSVWLKLGALAGSGTIQANGGRNNNGNGHPSSGGGRIAITVTNEGAKVSAFTGVITAKGGSVGNNNSVYGGAGTMYFRDAGQDIDHGTLVIDNGACAYAYKTLIDADMDDETVGSVVITNKGQLYIANNRKLSVNGDWTSLKASTGALGAAASGTDLAGTVEFVGSGVSTIAGTNVFQNLVCTAPGKTLQFANDATLTQIEGELTLTGEENNQIVLKSLNPSTQWLLKLVGAAAVAQVDASDSDASSGKTVVAEDSTGKNQNNLNWNFIASIKPGEAIVWKTDATSDDWSSAANWDRGRAPVATDLITIPAGAANYPRLVAATTVSNLTIASGASLSMAGFDFAVDGVLTSAGTMVWQGSETLTLNGDANLTGSTIATPPALLEVVGKRAQSVDFGALGFNKIVLANAASGATLAGGFTVKQLFCEQSDAYRTYAFESGKQFTVTGELRLKGAAGETAMLTLRSTSDGNRWNIASKGVAIVAGVNVADSAAATGNKIYACAPSSGSNCDSSWVFNVPTTVWQGTEDNFFTNGNNWSSGKVPDASTIAYVSTTASINLDSENGVDLLTLVVEDGGTATLTGSATLRLADALQVMDGGVLYADVPIEIAHDAVIFSGGTITVNANSSWDKVTDPADLSYKRINLTVGGSMVVEQGAKINATGKGFAGQNGPGYGGGQGGGGFAAWGFWTNRVNKTKASYGSVFRPMSLGSGGHETSDGSGGGGAIKLAIAGSLTLNGTIVANGVDAYGSSQSNRGSGGSIYITCSELIGAGDITANGGLVINEYSGAGGRIAVHQTTATDFTRWSGSVSALGGRRSGDAQPPRAPCGTIFMRSAGEGGTIYFNNEGVSDWSMIYKEGIFQYTDIISTNYTSDVASDFRDVTLDLRATAMVSLVRDLRIKDIQMSGTCTHLFLMGHTLAVSTRRHALGGTVVADGGHIEWLTGMMLLVK